MTNLKLFGIPTVNQDGVIFSITSSLFLEFCYPLVPFLGRQVSFVNLFQWNLRQDTSRTNELFDQFDVQIGKEISFRFAGTPLEFSGRHYQWFALGGSIKLLTLFPKGLNQL